MYVLVESDSIEMKVLVYTSTGIDVSDDMRASVEIGGGAEIGGIRSVEVK